MVNLWICANERKRSSRRTSFDRSHAGADPRGSIASPWNLRKYGNFIHHDFVQFGKQYSRHKVILASIVLSQQGCEVGYASSLLQ